MKQTSSASSSSPFDYPEGNFRLISPEDYQDFGIDPRDVPIGTFAAEDHPNFLLSRSGGNAYGLGLVEQNRLAKADFDFLQGLDHQDRKQIADNAKRLNQIYQRLGLLIRYTHTGSRYFLIPISLVAHSLQDVTTKADEIEELVLQYILETGIERLDIGLMTSGHDLLVHELRGRLSIHRLFLFETLEKIRSWRTRLDLVIFPRDPAEFLLEQLVPKTTQKRTKQSRVLQYGSYMAGKIHDILENNGRFVVLAHTAFPTSKQDFDIEFKSELDLKKFHIFSHVFRTKRKYSADGRRIQIHPHDFFNYLYRHAVGESQLRRLLKDRDLEEITVQEIVDLPYLNRQLPQPTVNIEKHWERVFGVYFDTVHMERKSPKHHQDYWQARIQLSQPLPENLFLYIGRPRKPEITLEALEHDVRSSGMMGCSLALTADYRNTFHYVLDVLNRLALIREKEFPLLSEIESDRLRNPFRNKKSSYEGFNAISRLIRQIRKLDAIARILNPDRIEGQTIPVLENLPKLSLHGLTSAQLEELLLIVVGHTTMSRIVVGKLPAKSLKPITDKATSDNFQETIEILRVCRLMSMAESAAAMGETFSREHVQELFDLYGDAVQVATNAQLNWAKLSDIRISELGGVQNKAVREMMKFFNLFEFLNNWREFELKGRYEKEVLCDYDPDKLSHLEDALGLADIASQFKAEFMGDHISSQSYFFRQFLETEFHGTGHLFPGLGTQTGFVLLWITVSASERQAINFNPMLSRIPVARQPQRIEKIRNALAAIPKDFLQPRFFESIRKTLSFDRPAFILDSGVRLMVNSETRAIDVSFVDVEDNIEQIEALLSHFESHKLRDISLKRLQDMERLFSELESYRHYLKQYSGAVFAGVGTDPKSLAEKDDRIGLIEARLREIFLSQIFVPEEIFDTISVLASHCPDILRFILPEFHAFGNLVENWPTRKKQSLGAYVMRSLKKFQALITKDRETFQDRNTFYQLAKREFGPLAEEDTGAKHSQLEILEHLVDRIQQTPVLYRAFTLALLFQDIGKVDKYSRLPSPSDYHHTHAELGASILQQTDILSKYQLRHDLREMVLSLIRRHGIIGHVIQGEEPVTALEYICKEQDSRLSDAFALHSILAAASVEEGLMTEDLLDLFLRYRRISLELIKSKNSWNQWLEDELVEKGEALLSDMESMPAELHIFATNGTGTDAVSENEKFDRQRALERGRQIAGLERLLRLMEVRWVDYPDLQMYLLNIPVNFIYHKRSLKSIGVKSFTRQLKRAAQILQSISKLERSSRDDLFRLLDPLESHFRIYDFHPLNRFLRIEECLKLLFLSLCAFERLFPSHAEGGLISFRPLSQDIEKRHGALRNLLREVDLSQRTCNEPTGAAMQHWGGLNFESHPQQHTLRIGFQDSIQLDHMIRSLTTLWNPDLITAHYENIMQELRKLPYNTLDYQQKIKEAYEHQCYEISNRILRGIQKQLKRCQDFKELRKILKEINKTISSHALAEDQEFLLLEIYEFHRDRLRKQYLENIYEKINCMESDDDLSAYWNRLKFEMLAVRDFVGKEYESLIARLIDEKMEQILACKVEDL